MYNAFFGLTKNPFGMAPDSEFLFLTPKHREAVAGLTYAITERKGFLVLTGSAGTGKTSVLTWVLGRLSGSKVETSVVLNPMLTPNEFLESVMLGFDLDNLPNSRPRRFRKLGEFLLKTKQDGSSAALIVDEAHKLTPELLEEIRLLGNYESHGAKLLQILLIGQSELDTLLNRPDLYQLKQRICVHLSIEPLDRPALSDYIQYRWTRAGGKEAPFAAAVIDRLYDRSGGIPRLVNALADNALMLAFAENQTMVRVEYIDSVAKDLQLTRLVAEATAEPRRIEEKPVLPAEMSKAGDASATPVRLTALERYESPVKPSRFFSRWVGKLGLA